MFHRRSYFEPQPEVCTEEPFFVVFFFFPDVGWEQCQQGPQGVSTSWSGASLFIDVW